MLNAGYWRMPDKTAEAWRNGWFHTGDAMRYDEDGNYYFVDRIKDAIRRRGENISSFEVEAYVGEHPDVLECAAIAVPAEVTEDDVKVVVVRQPGSALAHEQLHEYLSARMPRFMLPRYIEFVDSLPKTPTLRVKKVELRADARNANTWDRDRAILRAPG
jgi:crotonobetaine/carnitine-CoA ligase